MNGLFLFAVILCCAPLSAATAERPAEETWTLARYSTDGQVLARHTGFGRISDIAADGSGLLVAEELRHTISLVGPNGDVLRRIPVRRPRCVQRLGADRFLVCQAHPLRIVEVDGAGTVFWKLAAPVSDATAALRLPDGNTAVVHADARSSAVRIYDALGASLWAATAHLDRPRGLALLPGGEVVTSAWNRPLLVRFRPYGDEVHTIEAARRTESVSVAPGGGLVSVSSEAQVVEAWDAAGGLAWRFATLYPPHDAEVAADGSVWVSLFEAPDAACPNAARAAARSTRPLAGYLRWLFLGTGSAALLLLAVRGVELRRRSEERAAPAAERPVAPPPRSRRIEIACYVVAIVVLGTAAAVNHARTGLAEPGTYAALIVPAGLALARLRAKMPPDPNDFPARLAALTPMPAPTAAMWSAWAGGAALVFAALGGVHQKAGNWVVAPWSAGIVLLVAGALERRPALRLPRPRTVVLCGIVLAAVLAVRLHRLEDVPADIHHDSAQAAVQAMRVLDGTESGLFGNAAGEIPVLGFLWRAVWIGASGRSIAGVRFPSVVSSVLAIALTFVLVRRLYGTPAALVVVALLGFDKTFLHFSRIPSTYVDPVPFHAAAILGLVVGLESGRYAWFALAGLAAGYGTLTYHSGRVIPLLITLLGFAVLLRFPRTIRVRWPGILLAAAIAFAVVGPQALLYVEGRANPLGRVDQFPWVREGGVDPAALGDTIARGVPRVLGSFWKIRDSSTQYGGPVAFFPPIAALLGIGVVAAIARPLALREVWVVLWGATVLFVGGVLTVDPPFWPRLVMALVPAMIVVAAATAAIVRGTGIAAGSSAGRVAAAVVGALLSWNALSELAAYSRYDRGIEAGATLPTRRSARPQTIMGRDLQRFGGRAQVYIVARRPIDHSCNHPAMQYFATDTDVHDARDIRRYLPFRGRRTFVVYVLPEVSEAVSAVLEVHSYAERREFHDGLGRHVFTRLVIHRLDPTLRGHKSARSGGFVLDAGVRPSL